MRGVRRDSMVRFGSFEVNLRAGELRKNGARVRLPEQSFQVLAKLLEQAGQVVAREELRQELWPHGTVVEFEHGINSVVNRLRVALEDSPQEPRFIETLPKRGYRFLVPIDCGQPQVREKSIAVVPFANLSGEQEMDYFCVGLTEEILSGLSRVDGLRIAAKGTSRDMVQTVLEGSVRRMGERLRVSVQLNDVAGASQLWADRYECKIGDLFDVQDQIGKAVVDRLEVRLAGISKASGIPYVEELYRKGRHYWSQRSPSTMPLAIRCFEEAIQVEPQNSLLHAGLADCYTILGAYGWMSPQQARPAAERAVNRSVSLDPSLWEANFSRGFYCFWLHREWRAAEEGFQKAIEINPDSSISRAYYGLFLATAGRAAEAIAQLDKACEQDALSPFVRGLASLAYYSISRFEGAERMARHALELQPGYLLGLWAQGIAYCALGRHAEAIQALERAVTLSAAPLFVGLLGLAYARAGQAGDASRILRGLQERIRKGEYVPRRSLLHIYVGQGNLAAMRRELVELLEEELPPSVLRTTSAPFLEAYRGDREIDRLLGEFYRR